MQHLMRFGIILFVPRQRIGVGVVLVNEREQVLMLRHVFHPRTPWGLPGGWLNRNEDPKLGALRELKEETGLIGTIDKPVLVTYDSYPPHIGIAYRGKVVSGELSLSPEIIEANWFSQENLPSPIMPFVRNAISAAISSNGISTTAYKHSLNRQT